MQRSCTVENLLTSHYETEAPSTKDRHMLTRLSPKKVHEVSRLSQFTNQISKALNINNVVDIGAGEVLNQLLI